MLPEKGRRERRLETKSTQSLSGKGPNKIAPPQLCPVHVQAGTSIQECGSKASTWEYEAYQQDFEAQPFRTVTCDMSAVLCLPTGRREPGLEWKYTLDLPWSCRALQWRVWIWGSTVTVTLTVGLISYPNGMWRYALATWNLCVHSSRYMCVMLDWKYYYQILAELFRN